MEEGKKVNFFTHVFNFDDESRQDMINIVQYTVIGFIFVILWNKAIETYSPTIDPDKGVALIAAEIVVQVSVLFLGLMFVHRIIDFIPTLSGVKYAPMNMITVILPALVLLLQDSSNVGMKVRLIWEKMTGEGETKKTSARSTQPLQGQAPSILPMGISTGNPMANTAPPPIQEPDFNSMFGGANIQPDFEPVAANSGGVSLF
jgi:hypothetical protein